MSFERSACSHQPCSVEGRRYRLHHTVALGQDLHMERSGMTHGTIGCRVQPATPSTSWGQRRRGTPTDMPGLIPRGRTHTHTHTHTTRDASVERARNSPPQVPGDTASVYDWAGPDTVGSRGAFVWVSFPQTHLPTDHGGFASCLAYTCLGLPVSFHVRVSLPSLFPIIAFPHKRCTDGPLREEIMTDRATGEGQR